MIDVKNKILGAIILKKRHSFAIVVFAFLIIYASNWNSGYTAENIPATPTSAEITQIQEIENVRSAVFSEIYAKKTFKIGQPNGSVGLEDIRITADNTYASGWITRLDPTTGEVMPTEPGIFIAERIGTEWDIVLPSERSWEEAVRNSPDELISIINKNMLLATAVSTSKIAGVMADSGYLLPWAEGEKIYLSQSVTHDEYIPSGNAHYAFDFYYPKTMFNLYASKAGTVWAFKDTVPNNDHSDVNFIVLRNADNPNLYQLYLHLAQNSIPPSLKSIGAQVIQGQFVGVADNTGLSTGHHLHFQVQTQPYWPTDNPYWGASVDITFDDVSIYGGRPRTPYEYDEEFCGGLCEYGSFTYISANTLKGDLNPPYGNFNGVTMGQVIEADTINISGWASDADSGIYSGQLRALYDGAWHNLGGPFESTFSYKWDLCSVDNPVPNGVVSVGLQLYDWDGNWADYASLRHFIKDYDCPQIDARCTPTSDQITLFEDLDYEGGCVVFNVGSYPDAISLGVLGNNDAASIKVGSNVQATLYSEENYHGHSETFIAADNNLTDNLIGIDTLSALKVGARNGIPLKPIVLGPISGTSFSEKDLISLSWENGNNSIEFQVRYSINGGSLVSLAWQKNPFIYLGSLIMGDYTWQVRGRNQALVAGEWSPIATFKVISAPTLPTAVDAPYIDDMESSSDDWSDSGLWVYKNDLEMSNSGTHSWWYQGIDGDYDSGNPNYGTLTSPRINIPDTGYYLRFLYRYETETKGHLWDQRWVQISIDDDPYENLYQLQDDPQLSETTSWLQSKVFDLSPYAGHVIQIRFQFASLDASLNAYKGWGIDDFSITNISPSTCDDLRQDDTSQEAYPLSYSEMIKTQGEICPGGDYDYYKFDGVAGDRIVVDIDAQSIGSPLDSYLVLVDSNGESVLVEHDDEVYAQRRDPLLSYSLPHDGTYYIKVRAWKHPAVGDDDQEYTIRLYKDNVDPIANILIPASNSYLPKEPFEITAQVSDVTDGIGHVDFYWHNYDWVIPNWVYLGTDWDVIDGWKINFDPSGLIEKNGGAFYINAFDKAANITSAGTWNIGVDLTPPSTTMLPLEPVQDSSAVMLYWTGTDDGSGLNYTNLQFTLDEVTWQSYLENIYSREYWFVGTPDSDYSFRIRGVDIAGNVENYPSSAEAGTSIPSADDLCSAPDLYEAGDGDNAASLASVINPDGGAQIHNYCNPRTSDQLNDEDWISFTPQMNVHYYIQAIPLFGNVGTILELYSEDGTTLLNSGASSSFGHSASIDWTSDRVDVVYIRARHLDGRVIGNKVANLIQINEGYRLLLPVVNR